MSAAFDPTGYPRRYRAGPATLLVTSILCLLIPLWLVRFAVTAALKPVPPMILILLIAMPVIFIPMFVFLLANIWRGALTLHPNRIVYGPWPRPKTVYREELAGFRIGKPNDLLILIPRDRPREAFVITAPSFKKDAAFWHWLETLGDQPST